MGRLNRINHWCFFSFISCLLIVSLKLGDSLAILKPVDEVARTDWSNRSERHDNQPMGFFTVFPSPEFSKYFFNHGPRHVALHHLLKSSPSEGIHFFRTDGRPLRASLWVIAWSHLYDAWRPVWSEQRLLMERSLAIPPCRSDGGLGADCVLHWFPGALPHEAHHGERGIQRHGQE